MIRRHATRLAAAGCFAASSVAVAHHSASAFDQSREVVISGAIVRVGWVNPHVYFTVATAAPDGVIVEHLIHAGSVSLLTGFGVPRDALAVGKKVTVRAFPARRPTAQIALGFELQAETGEYYTLEVVGRSRAAAPAATVPAAGIAGRWLPRPGGFAAYIADVQRYLTAAGQASASDVESYRASVARCEPLVTPPSMLIPMVHDVTADERTVTITVDWMGNERTIHLDAAEHPKDLEPSTQGHSIGRWDGGSLVVDTAAFAPHRSGIIGGVAPGRRKHVVERFSPTDDNLHLSYEVTIEDPDNLSRPFSFAQVWDHRPDLAPSGAACDREVARLFLDLE
jgi:hypothetical protein